MSAEPSNPQPHTIRALFTRIARHYDQINRLISLGQDRRWRELALRLTEVPPGGRLLDVATGTGDVALMAARQGLTVVGADLTPAMVLLAQQKDQQRQVRWSVGDGLRLAFADESFDAVISAFMMRNVPDVAQAFAEQCRVVRPGGRVVCLEMTWPRRFPMSWLFRLYFFGVAPLVGQLISGDQAAYRYLPRSVSRFISPEELAQVMVASGLREATWSLRMGGAIALHVARK